MNLNFLSDISTFITPELYDASLKAFILIIICIFVLLVLRFTLFRFFKKILEPQLAMLSQRIISYLIFILFLAWIFHELGFSLGVLLGTAGILTVALGFASQTSVSNIISGIFLISERPFAVGDYIKIENTTGEVIAIDLLSIKLRTYDNLMVRIPNESVLKSTLTNLTRFPIRRLDIQLGVSYKEKISMVKELLLKVAEQNSLCLREPAPLFIFKGYGEYALNIQFSVWMKRENYLALQNSIQEEIKEAFDSNQIDIPYPHRVIINQMN